MFNFPFLPLIGLLLLYPSGLLHVCSAETPHCCLVRPFPKIFLKKQAFGKEQEWKMREVLEGGKTECSLASPYPEHRQREEMMPQTLVEGAGSGQRSTWHSKSCSKSEQSRFSREGIIQHMEWAWREREPPLSGSHHTAHPARASTNKHCKAPGL